MVFGCRSTGRDHLRTSCLSQQDEGLQRTALTEEVDDRKVIERRQHSVREIQELCGTFQAHQRNAEHLSLSHIRFLRGVLHMRSDLEVIRRERYKVVVVRVHHDVSAQISQLDEILLPRFRPPVRPRTRDHDRVDTEKGFGEADVEVGMEFAPVFGEVDRSPAAGDLGEVRSRVLGHVVGCEHGPGVEELPPTWSRLDHLWLVQADSEHLPRPVSVFAVSIPRVSDRYEVLGNGRNTCIEVGSSSTNCRKGGTFPRRPQGLIRTNGSSVGTTIPRPQGGGQRG